MNVYVTQPFPHEVVAFYECKYFLMLCQNGHRQSFQKRKYGRSVLKVSAREFAYDKRMAGNLSVVEQIDESGVSLPQMRDPHRCVNKNHSMPPLLGIGFSCFSVPPSLASLFPLSLAISASSPSLTNAVFSLIPVILDASSISLSSMFRVVLIVPPHHMICISMPVLCILVNWSSSAVYVSPLKYALCC